MKYKLSILIPTIKGREEKFKALMNVLVEQKTKDVEILSYLDKCRMTIGEKRNNLLDMAKGDYVVFIDDDDLVTNNYVSSILERMGDKPDCISISGIYINVSDNIRKVFKHGLKFKWTKKDDVLVRPPTHICAVKREIAQAIRFPQWNFAEDKQFSDGLLRLCKTEQRIDYPIYLYIYQREKEYNIKLKK